MRGLPLSRRFLEASTEGQASTYTPVLIEPDLLIRGHKCHYCCNTCRFFCKLVHMDSCALSNETITRHQRTADFTLCKQEVSFGLTRQLAVQDRSAAFLCADVPKSFEGLDWYSIANPQLTDVELDPSYCLCRCPPLLGSDRESTMREFHGWNALLRASHS